jgi:copper homeostasis protein
MLEIACFTASSAIAAANFGADRIELCASYSAGGTTPSLSTLHAVRKETKIPINVMVRPRAGDFNRRVLADDIEH